MQVSVENQGAAKRILTVTVPAADVKKAYNKELRAIAAHVRMPGFRTGKVPAAMIESSYQQNIVSAAVDQLLKDNMPQALKETNTNPYGQPSVTKISKFDRESDLTLTVEVESYPVLEIKPLSDLTIKHFTGSIGDADVDRMIETLRQQQAKWEVEDGLEVADKTLAKISFLGKVDGVPFKGGEADDFPLNVSQDGMIPGFTSQIIGHKAGDAFTITVTFPENYQAEELKGKEATFDITVKSVAKQLLPEVNDDFIAMFGYEAGQQEQFKDELRKNMERELNRLLETHQHAAICEALLAQYGEIDVPQTLVNEMIDTLRDNYITQMTRNNRAADVEKMKEQLEEVKEKFFGEQAKVMAREQVLFSNLYRHFGAFEPAEATIDGIIDSYAVAYESPDEVRKEFKTNKQYVQNIRAQAIQIEMHQRILSEVKVEPAESNFFDLTRS